MFNSLIIFFLQGITILSQILVIKNFDELFQPDIFGLYLSIITLSSWFALADLGIVNSLRNELTILFSTNRFKLANEYVSSAYFIYFILILIVYLLSLVCIGLLLKYNPEFFETTNSKIEPNDIFLAISLIFLASVINRYFLINGSISYSLHKPILNSLMLALFNGLFYASVIFIKKFFEVNLNLISYTYLICSIFVGATSCLYIFIKNKRLVPKLRNVKKEKIKRLSSIGIDFFIIQLSVVCLLSSDSIIIAALFNFDAVTTYKINAKIFIVFTLAHGALMSPLWSKYTLYSKNKDLESIFNQLKITLLITLGFLFLILVTIYFGEVILYFWFNHYEYYDPNIMIAIAILNILMLLSSNFSTIYNGIGATKLIVKLSLVTTILNIPFSIISVKILDMGVEGIAYGTALCMAIFTIILPLRLKSHLQFNH